MDFTRVPSHRNYRISSAFRPGGEIGMVRCALSDPGGPNNPDDDAAKGGCRRRAHRAHTYAGAAGRIHCELETFLRPAQYRQIMRFGNLRLATLVVLALAASVCGGAGLVEEESHPRVSQ